MSPSCTLSVIWPYYNTFKPCYAGCCFPPKFLDPQTLTFFVSDSDSSKLNGQQMVELKRGSTELKELLSGNDAAENDDVDEEFEINVYGQR